MVMDVMTILPVTFVKLYQLLPVYVRITNSTECEGYNVSIQIN